MTWQLGSMAVLAVALAAGFAWYERARPDARIVALVGTLAAFAALGRIAFAAVPNVKPTTDIVLIAGFALGGGPGVAVGAIAGLTSNFFFGQGPWTPWQMAAWGAIGMIGAGLARVTSARSTPPVIGRWPLAIVCCVVGFGFTAIQDVGDWVTYSDHSPGALGVYVGQGLGFDAVHAAGCLVFALALGPTLTRSVQRLARRLQVTWVPVALALIFALTLGPKTENARAAATSAHDVTHAAASYLLSAENADGGFGAAPGQPSNQLYTGWAALGLAAAGHDLNLVSHGGVGVMSYLRAGAGGGATADVGALERTLLVADAAGQPPRQFAGHDLVAALERRIRRDGSVSRQVNLTAFAILALRGAHAGAADVARALRWLASQQDRDGGFSFATSGSGSDVDDTGAALQALAGDAAAGHVRARAVSFLRHQQDRDGGFPSQPGMAANAQSTAWAIQGLDAAGVSVSGFHRPRAPSPLAYLNSLAGAGGAVRYARGLAQTPVWVTGEALMAIAAKPLPIAPPPPLRRATASSPPRGPAPRATSAGAATGPRTPGTGGASVSRLAGSLGVLTALLLAPVGLG